MTRNELLRLILVAADDVGRVFDHAEIANWPPGAVDDCVRLGLICRSSGSSYAPCPNCADDHVEPVVTQTDPDGKKRYFIWCPESMRVEVQPEMCEAWEVNPPGLAALVARMVGLSGKPTPILNDRFWRLGRTTWPPGSKHTRGVVLARGLNGRDANDVVAQIGAGGRAIVLVPRRIPDEWIWRGQIPPVIALSEIMTWNEGEPVLDVVALADAVENTDHQVQNAMVVTLNDSGKRSLRQQVKAEMKGHLEDDILVAAYEMHSSYRKAAEYLSAQRETTISKDQVRRAVIRNGGLAKIRVDEDSPSASRIVASQRRDRAKKFAERH